MLSVLSVRRSEHENNRLHWQAKWCRQAANERQPTHVITRRHAEFQQRRKSQGALCYKNTRKEKVCLSQTLAAGAAFVGTPPAAT